MNQIDDNPPRRLRVFLRDHRVLDASARVPPGQSLSTYLASRTRYVNLTGVEWVGVGEHVGHMAVKVDKILWGASGDGELALTSALTETEARRVEVELEGGYVLIAGLLLVPNQRLSDYLQSAPSFIPLRDAELKPRRKKLGDVVVNQEAIQVVRELDTLPHSADTLTGEPPTPESPTANAPTAESPTADNPTFEDR